MRCPNMKECASKGGEASNATRCYAKTTVATLGYAFKEHVYAIKMPQEIVFLIILHII